MTFSYDNLDFHRAIVGFAGIFAGYIRKTPALAGAADKLLEIDWYE